MQHFNQLTISKLQNQISQEKNKQPTPNSINSFPLKNHFTSPPYFFWSPNMQHRKSLLPSILKAPFCSVGIRGGDFHNRKLWTKLCLYITTWNPLQPTIYKWLFQLDDSQSLHRKWLFHQTSIYKWLFGGPGRNNTVYK